MSGIKSNKDRILEKIDQGIKGISRKLDGNHVMDSSDVVNLAGRNAALYSIRNLISSLNTDDKFLNTVYHQVALLQESPETFEGDVGGLGRTGKDEVIEQMMDYIKSLIE